MTMIIIILCKYIWNNQKIDSIDKAMSYNIDNSIVGYCIVDLVFFLIIPNIFTQYYNYHRHSYLMKIV